MCSAGPIHPERQLWLLKQSGESRTLSVADVALKVATRRVYSYAVADSIRGALRPGDLVTAPYGRAGRIVTGLCLRIADRAWTQTLKELTTAESGVYVLPESLAALGEWLSQYYFCPAWTVFSMLAPKALRAIRPRTKVTLQIRSTGNLPAPTAAQERMLAVLQAGPLDRKAALAKAAVGPSVLTRLIRAGVVEAVRTPLSADPSAVAPHAAPDSPEDHFDLTTDQTRAIAAFCEALVPGGFKAFLAFGVPGSGKTEVYVRCIRAAVARGRQAILLVPEIALATQIVDRLARRFARVAVMHSAMPVRQRAETLRQISVGEIDVVIGTRTAVFAPLPRLGLIVVDEEQEGSFKNLAKPYFHARDVAVKRGQLENFPVILGSATPSLESWHNATEAGRYQLLRLSDRVPGAEFPAARIVVSHAADGPPVPREHVLSDELREALGTTLRSGDQAIVLHNRRGYSTLLRCRKCGKSVRCPECSATLVLHQTTPPALRCHNCGRRQAARDTCPDIECAGPLRNAGMAIQRLEEELRQTYPAARLLRLDSDTMKRRSDYRAALDAFEARQADLLIGTQMVAKGLDFPGVRLVGVIDADAALYMPDFRAGERVFHLIMQVVGRAGRREGQSLALVQTQEAPPPVVAEAVRMNYEGFAARELLIRKKLRLPPYTRMARLVLADERPGRAAAEARRVAAALIGAAGRIDAELIVDPPQACPAPRVRNRIRWEFSVRSARVKSLHALLELFDSAKKLRPVVKRFSIDVDPLDFS